MDKWWEQLEKEVRKQIKEDLPKMDLRKVKLESISKNKVFVVFWYEKNKYHYNLCSKWLNFDDGLARDNLRKEFL